jgi:hypothetical protein
MKSGLKFVRTIFDEPAGGFVGFQAVVVRTELRERLLYRLRVYCFH